MEHVGIERAVAKAHEEEAHRRGGQRQRGEKHEHGNEGDRLPQPHELLAGKAVGQHAGEESPRRHAHVVDRHHAGCGAGRHAARAHEIARAPGVADALDGDGRHEDEAGQANVATSDERERARGAGRGVVALLARRLLMADAGPERQDRDRGRHDRSLDGRRLEVAVAPRAARERERHEERAHRNAHAVGAVEEVHVRGPVVQGDVVVERRVDGARAEAEGDRQQAEPRKARCNGKAGERRGGERRRDRRDAPGAKAADERRGGEAGDDGPAAGDHRDRAAPRDRDAEVGVHGRPCRAEERVGDAQTHEGDVDDNEKHDGHGRPRPLRRVRFGNVSKT